MKRVHYWCIYLLKHHAQRVCCHKRNKSGRAWLDKPRRKVTDNAADVTCPKCRGHMAQAVDDMLAGREEQTYVQCGNSGSPGDWIAVEVPLHCMSCLHNFKGEYGRGSVIIDEVPA